MSEDTALRPQILTAFRTLASEKKLNKKIHSEIAATTGIPSADIYMIFPAPIDLVDAHLDELHQQTVETYRLDDDDPIKNRLFDLLMGYFDALQKYRALTLHIEEYLRCHPHLLCARKPQIQTLFQKILLRCGIKAKGLRGHFRMKGLQVIFWATYRVWRKDMSEDMSATMATLDKHLGRAEQLEQRTTPFWCKKDGHAA